MNNEYKTAKGFVGVILNHQFNNIYLDIVVKKHTYATCTFTVTDKNSKSIHICRFGAFKTGKVLTGVLRAYNRKFIIADAGEKVISVDFIETKPEIFIDFIENNLIGIAE